MHPMQVPHYFCDDEACPSKHGGGGVEMGTSDAASAAVVADDEGSSGSGVVA